MKGYPERRGEGGWDFARTVEILVRRRRRRRRGMARSFRGGGRWQRLTVVPILTRRHAL